ncbi:MAG: hypothetical protein OEY63_03505 [Gemmatimonadota bacterium]|nr:hypothetical protein [Gemmatimonadota bacterium]MDH5803554.1 hypothetical protein [Gemmatimonadota bacterium]
MMHEVITSLEAQDIIERAKEFFAERVPHSPAYLEKQGPSHAVFRGQGGEEIALAVVTVDDGVKVRASTLLFDQTVARFLSTLPEVTVTS